MVFERFDYLCDGCPCLWVDNQGDPPTCGLGYEVRMSWTEDRKSVETAEYCGLTSIIHDGGEFHKPPRITCTGVHPYYWK